MRSWMASFLALAAVPYAVVQAKPEQIRGVTSPIFHYYLQAYPQDGELLFSILVLFVFSFHFFTYMIFSIGITPCYARGRWATTQPGKKLE